MLDYLVTSSTRRELLKALWKDGETGSASELARLTGASFAGVYRELRAMEEIELAVAVRVGNATVYRANSDHPAAALVDELLKFADAPKDAGKPPEEAARDVRWQLRQIGAPLVTESVSGGTVPAVEQVIADGLRFAHGDASVARVLPVCIWRNAHLLDFARLETVARRAGEKHTLGFFLDLTGTLAKDRGLRRRARKLRDRRIRQVRDFFVSSRSGHGRKLAEMNTPPLARRWLFRMNMGMDSFQSLFSKFTGI